MAKKKSELTKRQIIFCDYYVRDYDFDEACRSANISEKTGKMYLSDPACVKYISNKNDRAAQDLGLTKRFVVANLMKLVERSMQAEPVMKYDNITKEYVATGEYTFDGKTAATALKLLGEHLDIFDNPFDFVAGSRHEAENAPTNSKTVIIDDIPKDIDMDDLTERVLSGSSEVTEDTEDENDD